MLKGPVLPTDGPLLSTATGPAGSPQRQCSGPLTAPVKGHTIRVVTIDNAPWFFSADVCKALGLTNIQMAVKGLPSADLTLSKIEGQRGLPMRTVTEAGLYKLVLRSNKPEAKAFQDWVTRDVLPAIRKDGGYIMGEEKVATF